MVESGLDGAIDDLVAHLDAYSTEYFGIDVDPDIDRDTIDAHQLSFDAGKLTGGHFLAEDGKVYAGGQHGFARDLEHRLVSQTANELTFELTSGEETYAYFPYDFALRSTYTLEGRRISHSVSGCMS